MSAPFISFIVPVYNAEEFIGRCLDSIRCQTNTDIEIIVVDDGSTDRSSSICNEYAALDPRIHCLRQDNSGAGAARNRGLESATGEYVVFVDADDYIDRDLCEVVEKGESCDIIYFGYIEHTGRKAIPCKLPATGDCSRRVGSTLLQLFRSPERFFGFTWNKAFRRSLIEEYNLLFDPDLVIKEDEDFCVRFTNHISTLYLSDKCPYNYVILPTSLSHDLNRDRRLGRLAERIEADAMDCPWPALRRALVNAAYVYHLDGFKESAGATFNSWDAFVKRQKGRLEKDSSMLGIFSLRQPWLRRRLLHLAYLNPTVNFLRNVKRNLRK